MSVVQGQRYDLGMFLAQVRCHAESIKRHLDQFAVESKASAAKPKAPQRGDGRGKVGGSGCVLNKTLKVL